MASAEECDGTLAWPLDKAATRNSGHLRPRRWKLERAENVANTALGPKGIVPVPIVWSQVWARRTDYVLKLMAGIQCSGRDIEIDALRSVRKGGQPSQCLWGSWANSPGWGGFSGCSPALRVPADAQWSRDEPFQWNPEGTVWRTSVWSVLDALFCRVIIKISLGCKNDICWLNFPM